MEIRFLGVGAAFNPALGNTNAWFLNGEDFFLIDCGESAFAHLRDLPEMRAARHVFVLITHMHADHVGSLGSLISFLYVKSKQPATVVHPDQAIVRLLDLVGVSRPAYTYEPVLNHPRVRAEAVEVSHVPDMRCYGYLLDDGLEKVFYGGDSNAVPEQIIAQMSQGSLDRVYQDTSCQPSATHCALDRLAEMIPASLRHKVVCMHFDEDCRDAVRATGFAVAQESLPAD